MKKILPLILLAVLAVVAVLYWRKQQDAHAPAGDVPLAYVPADTPYVFANLAPAPDAAIAQWQKQMGELSGVYAAQFEQLRASLDPAKPEEARLRSVLDALQKDFAGVEPSRYGEHLGMDPRARVALYGLGLLPVLRLELAQPQRFEAFIGRIEAAAGEALPRADVDGQRYWRLGDEKSPLIGVAALVGRHLVLSLAPREATPAALRQILGLDRPAQSLAASGALQRLNQEFGYLDFFSGYVDSRRLVELSISEGAALEAEFLKALGASKPVLEPACKTELVDLAASWPRLSMGYTRFDGAQADILSRLEARADIASELLKLRAPMPGLKADSKDTLLALGLSLKLAQLPQVAATFAGRVAQAPWQCELLAPLNDAFAKAKKSLSEPAVYAAAPVFQGMFFALHELEVATPPRGRGLLVIGSDNPASLYGMAKPMLPQLANLDLKADGVARPLELGGLVPVQDPMHVAMSEQALAISVGQGEQDRLGDYMQTDPNQQPLLAFHISGELYKMIGEQVGQMLKAQASSATDEAARQRLERDAELIQKVYANLFKYTDARLEVTEQGLELRQTVVMQ